MNKTLAALCWVVLSACSDQTPIRIGFIGGTSGRFADLGASGRNGAQLAIDQRNASGGLKGRKLELIVEDDRQDKDAATLAFTALQRERVQAIVGPMTSGVATTVSPLADQAGLVMVSPTVTTTLLSGKNDHLFRVVASVKDFAEHMATALRTKRSFSHAVLLADSANADYSRTWSAAFATAFGEKGGEVLATVEYDSRIERSYGDLAKRALSKTPDIVIMITSATDAALLAQKLRELNPTLALAGSGWTATNRLIELGGKAVEGMIAEQYYDPECNSPAFKLFRQTYIKRFGEEPGFTATLGYDAASVVLEALTDHQGGGDLKAVLLRKKHFAGLQEEIIFDEFGDSMRSRHTTFVRNGRFVPLE